VRGIGAEVLDIFMGHTWPGNIRELRNVLERALLFADRPALEPDDLSFEPNTNHRSNSYNAAWTLEELERFHISTAFESESQNVDKTAKRLGIAKSTLYQKLKTMNLI